MHDPALTAGRILDCLDIDWAALWAGKEVHAAVDDLLVTDRSAGEVAVVTDGVTDSWVRPLGPAQQFAALRCGRGRLTAELTDALLRALLRRSAGPDRSVTLAARLVGHTATVPEAKGTAHVGTTARASQGGSSGASCPEVVHPLLRQEFRPPRTTEASLGDEEERVPLTYALTVRARVGRWVIARLHGAPTPAAAAVLSAGVNALSPASSAITTTGAAPSDRTKTAADLGSHL